nr:immunoglobulin light chain junction region [Macaca mulatta]
CLQGYSSTSSF